jgi:hypothetical protein
MAAGATPNPMMAQIMTALQQRSASGSAMPGMGAAQQSNPMGGGDEYGRQMSELKNADPGGLLRQLKAMKQICAIMLVQNLERLPNVAGQLSKMIPMFDRVIKEAQQAQTVNSAVRNPPIQMSAAQPSPEGGSPSPMGGGGF